MILCLHSMTLDTTAMALRDGYQRVRLTMAEYRALVMLAEAGGEAVTRAALADRALHHNPASPLGRKVDQLIFDLRCKLPNDDDGISLIRPVYGVGYLMPAWRVERWEVRA